MYSFAFGSSQPITTESNENKDDFGSVVCTFSLGTGLELDECDDDFLSDDFEDLISRDAEELECFDNDDDECFLSRDEAEGFFSRVEEDGFLSNDAEEPRRFKSDEARKN